ncbi:MAG: HAD family hydrolase [Anaerolineaceae bacterium]|nr:HAD family hydrolase [Anaerolineaceae bacterium]
MSLDKSRIRALCFDVDGTLSDTDNMWVHRFESILKPFHIFFPNKNTHQFARWLVMGIETPGNLVYNMLDRLGLDDEVAKIFNFISKYQPGKKQKRFWLIPETDSMLKSLHAKYPMAVVSARGEKGTLTFLEQFKLRSLFQTITTAQTCEYTKPFPDPIIWTAKEMGVEPHECLMIGDTTVDIRAGKAAGAQTVGVLCGFGKKDELIRAGADIILETTTELTDLLL